LSLAQGFPGSFIYQTTSPANQLTGSPNTSANIAPGAAQNFVFGVTPNAALNSVDVGLVFSCANAGPAASIPGVNNFILSASNTLTPDIVAIGATQSGDGIVNIPGNTGTGAFAAAAVNIGSPAPITASADDGGRGLPMLLSICQTDPNTGACLAPPGPSTTTTINSNATLTFTVFANGTANIPFDPANTRIYLRFKDAGGVTRGATTVAVRTVGVIPPDRNFSWNPGMMSKGGSSGAGIPTGRTQCGAVLSPSGGDDSAAIQAAVSACPAGQMVKLGPGTFKINSSFILIDKGITLRGSGAGVTILSKTNGARARTNTVVPGTIATGGSLNNRILMPSDQSGIDVQPIIIVGQARWPKPDSTTSQNLTADGAQGAMSVTIANASGFAAGQWVLLDEISRWSYVTVPPGYNPSGIQVKASDHVVFQMHNPPQSWDDPPDGFGWFSRGYPSNSSSPSDTDGRMTNEIKEIASVAGNVVTFTTPLSIGYRVNHLAQLTRYTANSNSGNGGIQVVNAGVENLTTTGGGDGSIRFEITAYCWAKNVEVTQWLGEGIAIDGSFRVEIRDSYIHTGADPTPGGQGYAISLANGSSEILIENNISRDVNKVMVARSSGTGSIVAYNYMDDGWISYSTTWQEVGLNATHMAGSHHVLFEGNWGFNADADYTHGNSGYMTYFRNYTTGQRGSWTGLDDNARAAGLSSWAKAFSFIGNVLGRPGQMSGWKYTDPMMGCDSNGSNCVGQISGSWGQSGPNIWQVGYDATNQWTQQAEQGALTTVIRDGNYDFLTNSQHWHNTPGGFAIPSSLYLNSKPAFFGTNVWPWVDPTTGAMHTLPAKARYDAGTPNSP
jgi:hypothetical protein